MDRYIVQYGDSLWTISEKILRNSARWKEIARLNNLKTPSQLYVGQILILPTKKNPKTAPPSSKNGFSFLLNNGLSSHRIVGYPARAFFFIVADEINPFGK